MDRGMEVDTDDGYQGRERTMRYVGLCPHRWRGSMVVQGAVVGWP